jgi:hypothetical protein
MFQTLVIYERSLCAYGCAFNDEIEFCYGRQNISARIGVAAVIIVSLLHSRDNAAKMSTIVRDPMQ